MRDHPATNRWNDILPQLGVDAKFLRNKQGPCPVCHGKDRFRYDNKNGQGTYYCNQCGAGDGFRLVMLVHGIDFAEAAKKVEALVGSAREERPRMENNEAQKKENLKRVWTQGQPNDDVLIRYLGKRGIPFLAGDPAIRYHPDLPWREDDRSGKSPAMIAKVYNPGMKPVSVHRTYLGEGVPTRKKMMPSVDKLNGCFIPLGGLPADGILGIAEGIETAMSGRLYMQMKHRLDFPVWSCVSADMLERFRAPEGVTHLVIFGDLDASSFHGQKAAYTCAFEHAKLKTPVKCTVLIPNLSADKKSRDWNDVIQELAKLK